MKFEVNELVNYDGTVQRIKEIKGDKVTLKRLSGLVTVTTKVELEKEMKKNPIVRPGFI